MSNPNSSFDDISHIKGNVSDDIKHLLCNPGRIFGPRFKRRSDGLIFGQSVHERLRVVEISVNKKLEEPSKMEGRVVMEIEMTEDMANAGGKIHGGCSAFIIDICSTLALAAINMATTGKPFFGVSHSLNLTYHSPADIGDLLRVVNTSVSSGSRTHTARSEIWNVTKRRIVTSGTHTKMEASADPVKAKI